MFRASWIGILQYLGGVVANLAAVPEGMISAVATLPVYTSLFNKLGVAAIACTLIALAALPLMRRLTATHHAHQ